MYLPPVEVRVGGWVLTVEDAGPPGGLPVLVHSGGGVPSSVSGRGAGRVPPRSAASQL